MHTESNYTTARLSIRRASEIDGPELGQLMHDGSIQDMINPSCNTIELFSVERIRYIARTLTDGALVGMVAVKGPALSYCVAPEFRSNGYGGEMAKCFVEAIAPSTGMSMIEATIIRENISSRRLIERLGFSFIGLTSIKFGRNDGQAAALVYRRHVNR